MLDCIVNWFVEFYLLKFWCIVKLFLKNWCIVNVDFEVVDVGIVFEGFCWFGIFIYDWKCLDCCWIVIDIFNLFVFFGMWCFFYLGCYGIVVWCIGGCIIVLVLGFEDWRCIDFDFVELGYWIGLLIYWFGCYVWLDL